MIRSIELTDRNGHQFFLRLEMYGPNPLDTYITFSNSTHQLGKCVVMYLRHTQNVMWGFVDKIGDRLDLDYTGRAKIVGHVLQLMEAAQ